jgi:hypothetical protein
MEHFVCGTRPHPLIAPPSSTVRLVNSSPVTGASTTQTTSSRPVWTPMWGCGTSGSCLLRWWSWAVTRRQYGDSSVTRFKETLSPHAPTILPWGYGTSVECKVQHHPCWKRSPTTLSSHLAWISAHLLQGRSVAWYYKIITVEQETFEGENFHRSV